MTLLSYHILLAISGVISVPVWSGVGLSSGVSQHHVSQDHNAHNRNSHESFHDLRDTTKHQPDLMFGERPQNFHGDGSEKCFITMSEADCSSRGFHNVPQGLPSFITSLNLYNNRIISLPNDTFAHYFMLNRLNISHNNISNLSNLSFRNLSRLISLDLQTNALEMTSEMFPDDVFLPLTSLTSLNISNNNKNVSKEGLTYPDVALSHLVSLQELHMDGLAVDVSRPFGYGFKNLTQLTNLSLGGYLIGRCSLIALWNNTFENLDYLEHLTMADCNIHGNRIDSGAFLPLKRLKYLDLSHNEDIDIDNLDQVFFGLKDAANLTHLHMHLVSNRYSLSVCLNSDKIKYFPQHLTYFDARENNLEAIDRQIIDKLSKYLEHINLSGNEFVFGAYLQDLPKLKKLKSLKLNGLQSLYNLPSVYPYDQSKLTSRRSNSNCTIYLSDKEPFTLMLPPNLISIEMNNAGLKYILSNLTVSEGNSLQTLFLSGNHFPRIDGPIYGLHSLVLLDLSLSFVSHISDVFFQNLTSLETLILHSNLLGHFLANEKHCKVFSYLTNLKTLDLSFNYIDSLATDVFSNLAKMTKLLLSRNPLVTFNVQITHMNSLELLNLSSTHISTLPPKTRAHITKLATSMGNVMVDMRFCQINCDCGNLEFLTWMTTSRAFDRSFKNYSCTFRNLTQQGITDRFKSTMSMLTSKCLSKVLLVLIVGSATVLMFVFIIGAILFRFRWNIRYIYYAAYLRYKKRPTSSEHHFEFDAFICYAEEDKDFAECTLDKELKDRGLKILLHRRDFTAGELITSNIVRAVCASKKTIVVLTRSLMKSHWCPYEIEMAKMEGVYSGRQVLVFLIMEDIPRETIGRDLLYNIKKNTYQEYPSPPYDADQMKVWWDKIANDITN